jgi:hypothetical protein
VLNGLARSCSRDMRRAIVTKTTFSLRGFAGQLPLTFGPAIWGPRVRRVHGSAEIRTSCSRGPLQRSKDTDQVQQVVPSILMDAVARVADGR